MRAIRSPAARTCEMCWARAQALRPRSISRARRGCTFPRATQGRRLRHLDAGGAARSRRRYARSNVERGAGMSGGRGTSAARVAVVQLPGVNCEAETARALERVGLEAEVFRWTR